jgi:Carboxypeptidase regulatory-like domain
MSNWSRAFLVGIAIALAAAVVFASNGDDQIPLSAKGAAAALAVLGLLLGAWFLKSFVLAQLPAQGAARDEALTDIYAFAYTFTLLSLAVLALPFGNLLNAGSLPDAGPVRLLRGCLVAPDPSTTKKTAAAKPGAAAAASAASAASASTSSTEDTTPAKIEWPKGLPLCNGDLRDVHTVLITIGGVIASAAPELPASAASAGRPAVYQVRDGFVVPSLMIVLAIVGAAVNLMRRVPEVQKRAHLDFTGTQKETRLEPCEAREFVAFQILQLISAPFIAMVAFYVVAPQSLPSAIALAFVSGLFSEGVLLRIRALVEGPEKTVTQATAQPMAELQITAKDSAGAPVPGALISIYALSSGKKINEALSDTRGVVSLKGVPVGTLRISATGPGLGAVPGASVNVTLSAGQSQHADVTV